MAEDYLTDDEQLEHVKRLAAEYGPWTIGAVVLGLAFVTGYRYYQGHQDQRALAAGAQFEGMASAVQTKDQAKVRQIADGLVKDFPGSPYADQGQLALAGLYVDQGEDANAVAPLTAVMEHSKDTELRRVARLRLARVLIDQGKPDDALKLLSADANPGSFVARYHDVRGDAYLAKKDPQKAGDEYKAAFAEGNDEGMDSALLALKIADLGLGPTATPAPTTGAVPGVIATPAGAPPAASPPKAKP